MRGAFPPHTPPPPTAPAALVGPPCRSFSRVFFTTHWHHCFKLLLYGNDRVGGAAFCPFMSAFCFQRRTFKSADHFNRELCRTQVLARLTVLHPNADQTNYAAPKCWPLFYTAHKCWQDSRTHKMTPYSLRALDVSFATWAELGTSGTLKVYGENM